MAQSLLAIVGILQPIDFNRVFIKQLAEEGTKADVVVVSGLALRIDTAVSAAHSMP